MKGGLYHVYKAERHEHDRLAANRRNEDLARQHQSDKNLSHAGKNRLNLTNQAERHLRLGPRPDALEVGPKFAGCLLRDVSADTAVTDRSERTAYTHFATDPP